MCGKKKKPEKQKNTPQKNLRTVCSVFYNVHKCKKERKWIYAIIERNK